MSLENAHIAVIGGGLGGLACTLSLLRSKAANPSLTYQVKCYERDRTFNDRMNGYGLTLTYNPKGPLASLGILETVAQADTPSRSHYTFAHNGDILSYFGNAFRNIEMMPLGQRGNMRVPRQVLRRILLDEIEKCGGAVEWGKDFNGFEVETSSKLLVSFKDGTKVSDVAVLIGADGVRSSVMLHYVTSSQRPQVSLPLPSAEYFGIMLVLGISPYDHPLLDERGYYQLDGNARLFTMPFSQTAEGRQTMFQLSFNLDLEQANALRASGPSKMKAHVLSMVSTWAGPVHALISAAPESTIWGSPLLDRTPKPICAKGLNNRVAILGDAIHAMSPFKGQGANQALTDGPLLAEKLVKNPRNIFTSLANFEREMINRSKAKVADSRKAAKLYHSAEALKGEPEFSGVPRGDVQRLIEELRKRGIGADTNDLDNAVRRVINDLGITTEGYGENARAPVVSDDIKQAVLMAASAGDIAVVRQLSQSNPASLRVKEDETGANLLHVVCRDQGDCATTLIKWLVKEAKIDKHEQDAEGRTPLNYLQDKNLMLSL